MENRVKKLEFQVTEVSNKVDSLHDILNKIEETLEKFSNAIVEMTKNTIRLNKTEKDINKLFEIVREDEGKIQTNTELLDDKGKDRLKFGLQIALSAVSASFIISMGALGYILKDVKGGLESIEQIHTAINSLDKKVTLNDYKLDNMNSLIISIKKDKTNIK